jgi:hypothetical protein
MPGDPRLDSLARAISQYSNPEVAQSLRSRLERHAIMTRGGESALPFELQLDQVTAPAAGNALVELDRELRRAALFVARPPSKNLRPKGPPALEVVQADPGSLDFLLLVVDKVRDVLLSDPLQLALTLAFFLEHWPAVRGNQRPKRMPSSDPWEQIVATAETATHRDMGVHLVGKKGLLGRWEIEFTTSPAPQPRRILK